MSREHDQGDGTWLLKLLEIWPDLRRDYEEWENPTEFNIYQAFFVLLPMLGDAIAAKDQADRPHHDICQLVFEPTGL